MTYIISNDEVLLLNCTWAALTIAWKPDPHSLLTVKAVDATGT